MTLSGSFNTSTPAEARQAMSAAYDSVMLAVQSAGISVSPQAIADKVAAAVLAGERNMGRIAEAVLRMLLPKRE
jgi:hypothetical protein